MKKLAAALIAALFALPAQAQNTLFPANPGDMIYRNAVAWAAVPGGTAGCMLMSNGPAAAPSWQCALPLNFQLPPIATNRVWGNVSGGQAVPSPIDVNQFLNTVGYDQLRTPPPGSMIYLEPTTGTWQSLVPTSNAGWVLANQGIGKAPQWAFAAGISTVNPDNVVGNFTGTIATFNTTALSNCLTALTYNTTTHAFGCNSSNTFPSTTRPGDIIYWNGSAWVAFPGNNTGTAFFTENGSGAPAWSSTSSVTYKCNGSADAAGIQAADTVAAAAGVPLYLTGACIANVPLVPSPSAKWICQGATIYANTATVDILDISNASVTITGCTFNTQVTRSGGYSINVTAANVHLVDVVVLAPQTGIRWQGNGGVGFLMNNVSVQNATAGTGVSYQMEDCTACLFNEVTASAAPGARPNAHLIIKNMTDATFINTSLFQAVNVIWITPGNGQSVSSLKFIGGYADSGTQYGVVVQPSGTGNMVHSDFIGFWAYGGIAAVNLIGVGNNINGLTFDNVDMFSGALGLAAANATNINVINSRMGPLSVGVQMDGVTNCIIDNNNFGHGGLVGTGISLFNATDKCYVSDSNRFSNVTTAISDTSSGTANIVVPTASQTYTPTMTCNNGSLASNGTTMTATGRWKHVWGKFYWVQVVITETVAGTCNYPKFTLPNSVNSAYQQIIKGKQAGGTNMSLTADTLGVSTTALVSKYDGAIPDASGAVFVITGLFEAQ